MKLLWFTCLLACVLDSQAQRISATLQPSATLVLERVPFTAAGKALTYYAGKQPSASRSLLAINGKPFFGTDGELPQYTLAKAALLLKGRRYNLRVDRMYNPWFGDGAAYYLGKESFKLLKTGRGYKLRGMFSDGAGGYEAEWLISGSTAVRTVLTTDDAYFF